MQGSYILILHSLKEKSAIIGNLGTISLKKGYYAYVGSAMGKSGPSTLENRVKRHFLPSKNKKIHWHIDYLLDIDTIVVEVVYLIPSMIKLECLIARDLLEKSEFHVKNFGSSDCKCKSHLFFFKNVKDFYNNKS